MNSSPWVLLAAFLFACDDTTPSTSGTVSAPMPSDTASDDADLVDAAIEDTATADGEEAVEDTPPCAVTDEAVRCDHQTTFVGPSSESRTVHWQVPSGSPPVSGWPVVFAFHGSFLSGEGFFSAEAADLFGEYTQARVTAALLDAGFAVLAPEADPPAAKYWDTNQPLYSGRWTDSPDHQLMIALFAQIEAGAFGPLDAQQMFAMGLSSGGYMASRMAVAYPDRFERIAVASASYATCAGPVCVIPSLSAEHPPTLLMHGSFDAIVPLWTARLYDDRLTAAGAISRLVVVDGEGHAWIEDSPDQVVDWFRR
ncbi:MAG: alpha/beta hydrolase-fold protein [Myxococcota bacterium]